MSLHQLPVTPATDLPNPPASRIDLEAEVLSMNFSLPVQTTRAMLLLLLTRLDSNTLRDLRIEAVQFQRLSEHDPVSTPLPR
ncbi:hypothetical protein [Deinococcus ruber]|uniref:Uncharacterized protein n=1 Tax=Deinococcus ruber TaxID=1848197 RepID=A0A918FHE6_9DEIO|nr:hypothetical protein [Deinococcus ruber]GGR37857.1 hypothetical protein GCM10008957_53930 [Deinococcus ruber]